MADIQHQAATLLIDRHPLAWLVSRRFHASPLPLLAERDEHGRLQALFGHCARSNPLVEDFASDSKGLALFNGPSSYISPRYVSRTDWAPTWNFAALRVGVEVEFVPAETGDAVQRLLAHLERQSPGHWSTAQLGDRYHQMLSHIIAFRAHVRQLDPRFKLGQDERPEEFREICDHSPDPQLVEWMQAFAAGRLPATL
ncbi:FMN-binding negative transcriptional regulator [Altererythrobacter xixiisoli]|uniref:FMN-binding negative transcriptional regulator n=1 Tax=Croceibacterium xixiisoli TaxID=1476466 RepID=A0A6I4TZV8_9SPHN|nr:FMN-binding negative transcriptional regulator [Croceibacterium xixiisoli]MXP00630.1 FMN-binding negative transcriptional regulator [Croceibacterium xixiisoli]